MHFARALRAAGLPIGPGRVLDAVRAVETVGITNRQDFYWTLHAVFVNRHSQRELFDQTFHLFWKNPQILEKMMSLILPEIRGTEDADARDRASRRVIEALHGGSEPELDPADEYEVEFDAALTYSPAEMLQRMDFEEMSAAEIEAAKAAIRRMRLPLHQVATRRFRRDPSGPRINMRDTLRSAMRSGGSSIPLIRKRQRQRPPELVVLCDISGSMSRYSRMLLHFMHALTNDRDRVHTLLFGTRLTNVTHYLREKDVDVALDRIGEVVEDWSGGTRIGHCLHEFNRDWSRRVLAQGAVLLFISDGLDRDPSSGLEAEMERLHKSCRTLIWLNPLLRYEGFEPRAAGIRAILPHVDQFRPVHNLESLEQLTKVLGEPVSRRAEGVTQWQRKAA
ncbi:MAG: VWA domain-containing protein [Alphaproteobacteria bacterium]|nr:VWA domain-containing protein [Alphaproteobacteria bacterium]